MTKEQFTNKLQNWLDQPKEQRNLEEGALLVLQLTNNKIMYRNISRNIASHADYIEFIIKRYLSYRLQNITHEQVEVMQRQVDNIVQVRNIDKPSTAQQTDGKKQSVKSEWKAGKRADHDSLPPEIQALYVENASIMQRMRELHMKLRSLSGAEATCPDSDRYPFLKEIIALDKKYHANWKAYDGYEVQNAPDSSTTSSVEDALSSAASDSRMEQKNIQRQINLTKGRYKKNPTDSLKEKLASLYNQLASPTNKLTTELKELGVID